MITFVYGTQNEAKLQYMEQVVSSLGIKIVRPCSNIPEPLESGSTPLENARIKAVAYYEALKVPVFSCDSALYIEGLSDEEQPGVHVHIVNGRYLNDEEMIEYYSAIATKLGGMAVARYVNGICLVISEDEIYEYSDQSISGTPFGITNIPHIKRVAGFPLDCLSVHLENNRYFYDTKPLEYSTNLTLGFQQFFKRVLIQKYVVLREYTPTDGADVLRVFYDSVHSVASSDYTKEQLDAWAPDNLGIDYFNSRIQLNNYVVVALYEGAVVGFGASDDKGYFDLLYVHSQYQRIGVASLIADKIEELLFEGGFSEISVDASITARGFFERRGYLLVAEQHVSLRGQTLTNFSMKKTF